MADKYCKLTIQTTDEILLALLADQFPIESLEENQDHTIAYFLESSITEEVKSNVKKLMDDNGVGYEWMDIEYQNWNEVWESNFEPVDVDDICRIRAEFHESNPKAKYEIVIQPKMAFGTGHHQTTYMMIKQMHSLDFRDKQAFDFGGGTGVLAIFASMLGAKDIDAVDIEEESYLNTIENCERNNIPNVKSIHGVLETVGKKKYDIILANINRNILMQTAEELSDRIVSGGYILLSGFLESDAEIIESTFEDVDFEQTNTQLREGWVQMTLKRI